MKNVKPLDIKDLTLEQKLGMVICANLRVGENDVQTAIQMVKEHRLGAIWLQYDAKEAPDAIARVLEAADYPILVLTDAENGLGNATIPQAISVTAAGAKDEYAYSFGLATADALYERGYNVVCNPVVDLNQKMNAPCGHTTRTFGADPETAARLGAAMARGIHDGGLLAVSKHYPGGMTSPYDTHMREGFSTKTAEELYNHDLVPYRHLLKEGLLDGVMSGHGLFPKIDEKHPASLSEKVLSLLRQDGFDGFFITDALNMMGLVLKFGKNGPVSMCIGAGNDLALPWTMPVATAYDAMKEGFEKGIINEEILDAAVARILKAQAKTLELAKTRKKATQKDFDNIRSITTDCISARCAEGVKPSISRDGKHLFVIVTEERRPMNADIDYTPGARGWFVPTLIGEHIAKYFPNSEAMTMPQYPSTNDNMPFLDKQTKYDDVIFVTAAMTRAYVGRDCLSSRLVDLMDALQSTNRISTHIHFGNPFVAADAPYIERVIMGYCSADCVEHAFKILAGEAEAKGVIPYDCIEFHKKGHIFM